MLDKGFASVPVFLEQYVVKRLHNMSSQLDTVYTTLRTDGQTDAYGCTESTFRVAPFISKWTSSARIINKK